MARKLPKRIRRTPAAGAGPGGCTALYIRVSTDKQAEEGYSLDAQRAKLTAFCAAHSWSVDAAHIYVDAGLSGSSTEARAALQRMRAAAQAGQVQRIVALKLDRLARNVRDFLAIVDELADWGSDLVLLAENFDTAAPTGKFALTMFAAMAELEAATITERVMSGKRQKATTGGYNGAPVPLGYDYDGAAFTPNQDAATIRWIFAQFAAGQTLTATAAGLNAAGAPTRRGGRWYAATVRYILTNGFYAGLAQWDGVEQPNNHPALVERTVYEAAIARLASLRPGPPRTLNVRSPKAPPLGNQLRRDGPRRRR